MKHTTIRHNYSVASDPTLPPVASIHRDVSFDRTEGQPSGTLRIGGTGNNTIGMRKHDVEMLRALCIEVLADWK